MKLRLPFLTALAALSLAGAAAAQAPAATPAASTKVEKLADGVWAMAPEKGANVGWFLLGDGVVAVDSGADAATGAQILKQIADTTGNKPVRLLVLTHSHADHSGGARAFAAAGARVICQESIAGQIVGFLSQAATDPNDPMAGKASLRPVVESISERAILVDGIHNVQIYFLGPAHTKGDLVVYLASEKVLFPGDIALNGRQPFMQSPDMDPAGWTRALEALARVPVTKMVPGHGDIGPTTGIADSHAYVKRVDELAHKFAGLTDQGIELQVRSPDNRIENVSVTDAHIANVKAAVKALKEKEGKSQSGAAKPAPSPTPK
ncbi:MAG TPA: MBL fold metallo-hydrolase [Thermoanaerobaculia bacterium]|jgi:glyoxylase-like metal-dependent hydrolase (beta-lactamase superfamily II)|nr:MBL fold metallo-hydrolase [Thermoanaerobaculia bacterium]